MSLLTKLLVLAGLCCVIAWGIYRYEIVEDVKEVNRDRFLSSLGNSISDPNGTILLLRGLLEDKKITEEELLLLVELALESSTQSIDPLLDALEGKLNSGSTDWQVLEACIDYREGKIPEAKNKLAKLVEEYANHRRANYEFQRMRWISGGIEERIPAKLALLNLSKGDDRWAYKALRVLSFSSPRSGLTKDDLINALGLLLKHPRVISADFLRASELLMSIDKKRNLDQALEIIRNLGKGVVDVRDLGMWLVRFGESEKTLELVTQKDALVDEASFFVRFQALLESNKTKGAQDLLDQSNHLSAAKLLQANAYLDIVMGKDSVILRFLEDAEALKSAHSLLDVSRFALLKGRSDLAYRSFKAAWQIDSEVFNLSQANQFLQISLSSRNTQEAQRITGELKQRHPDKFGNSNNYCYLSLLIGEEPEPLEKEALRIVQAFPGNPSFLSTVALAKLLTNQPAEALAVMNQRGPTPLIHGERALLAAILQAAGNIEDAQKVARGLQEQRMLPEEWALLGKYGLIKSD